MCFAEKCTVGFGIGNPAGVHSVNLSDALEQRLYRVRDTAENMQVPLKAQINMWSVDSSRFRTQLDNSNCKREPLSECHVVLGHASASPLPRMIVLAPKLAESAAHGVMACSHYVYTRHETAVYCC